MALLAALFFLLDLFTGSVEIPVADVVDILTGAATDDTPQRFIILGSRLPQALTALLGGAALAVAGLMLQTAFRNPLADPSILGISSGASLGVAIVMLAMGGTVGIAGSMMMGESAVMLAAFLGAMAVIALLILLSSWLRNGLTLLIAGIMTGYLASSLIMILNATASEQGLQNYVMWGMGTFSGVTMSRMPLFAGGVATGLLLAMLLVKPLNLLLLGDNYARNLGVSLRRTRNILMLSTGILTATVTAFCGPISFIGLAVPHIARMIWRTDNHAILLPATMLTGASVALGCCFLSMLSPSGTLLPVNAVTSLVGVPVVLYIIFRRR